MLYPEDFKKRVKEVYPNWDELHQAMERGENVGKFLFKGFMSMETYYKKLDEEGIETAKKELRARYDLLDEFIDFKYQQEIEQLDAEEEEEEAD